MVRTRVKQLVWGYDTSGSETGCASVRWLGGRHTNWSSQPLQTVVEPSSSGRRIKSTITTSTSNSSSCWDVGVEFFISSDIFEQPNIVADPDGGEGKGMHSPPAYRIFASSKYRRKRFFHSKCIKRRLATGLRPGPQGSLHRSPDSIAGLKGAAFTTKSWICHWPNITIHYDAKRHFNVRLKAGISQLNLPHRNRKNKKVE